jgi:hypothetical protein
VNGPSRAFPGYEDLQQSFAVFLSVLDLCELNVRSISRYKGGQMQRRLKEGRWRASYEKVVGRQLARMLLDRGTHGECKDRGMLLVSITPSSAPVEIQFYYLSTIVLSRSLTAENWIIIAHRAIVNAVIAKYIFDKRYNKITVIYETSG